LPLSIFISDSSKDGAPDAISAIGVLAALRL
jgi:hypothetical protein